MSDSYNLTIEVPNQVYLDETLGDKLQLSPEVETAIANVIKMKAKVEEAEKFIKDRLIKTGLAADINFGGAVGSRVSVSYYDSGAKYTVSDLAEVEDKFKSTTVKLDPDKVDAYQKLNDGNLPDGVEMVAERSKTCKLTAKKQ